MTCYFPSAVILSFSEHYTSCLYQEPVVVVVAVARLGGLTAMVAAAAVAAAVAAVAAAVAAVAVEVVEVVEAVGRCCTTSYAPLSGTRGRCMSLPPSSPSQAPPANQSIQTIPTRK